MRDLYARTRAALGLDSPATTHEFDRAGAELHLPCVVHRTPSGPALMVLEAHDSATLEDVLDSESGGRLLDPLTTPDGAPVEHATAKALSAIFLAEHPEPPAVVLVQSGAWLLLAERTRWPEGRWLAIDLATACERRDTRAAGELETIAALVGADMLLPGEDASVPFTGLLEQSVTHAVGVSKDLRDGVRESIEVVAQEVLDRRRRAGLTDGDNPEERADLARRLTRESLRYLYRVLFLLYAEARPELGILPVKAPEYAAGYGLDRLRELVQVDLTTDRARHRVHLYESIQRLVDLVDRGHDGGEDGLTFESLRADLFAPTATPLIDEVRLGNEAVQRVLDRLLLSRRKRGRDRGFVSYAQLGINQLGAVYEGLMSYQGRIADAHLIEVAKDGDPDKGSWLMSESDWATAGLPDDVIVHRTDPDTGEGRRVRHRPGDFVLRLSGRDRQRSASYYTPQVLTACVVRHSLAELLDQPVDPEQPDSERRRTTAAEILRWRICEPALGSGAFLVEAIDQIAATYLERAQAERGEQIDPDAYPGELQKVKAYLALHNCYGVDLNATAVELAEITLWLASMHPGLQAPWFGLRLRRGNSLIGARRAGYKPADFAKATWWKEVPTDVALGDDWPAGYVHHFLLPSAGWGAIADTKEARELEPDRTAALKEWRKGIRRAPSKEHAKRLQALARRVEVLWALARVRLELAEAESRRDIDVWGAEDLPASRGAVSREQIEASLADANGAYQRLRLAMDAWCAMWFWPVHRGTPPSWDQWVRALEGVLGIDHQAPRLSGKWRVIEGQEAAYGSELTWESLGDEEAADLALAGVPLVDEVASEHPWLAECRTIAEREGFFHWELDFAPVFDAGGFDLQVGNPPWVRPDWEDDLVLAEVDPWFALAFKPTVAAYRNRRDEVLRTVLHEWMYLNERASMAALAEHLSSSIDRPMLSGLQPDLYRCFMDRTWRSMAPTGIVGLIHPDSHFTEARAGALRQAAYEHLRRHFQFRNELRLFEVHHTTEYGISVYGSDRDPRFLNAASIYEPSTIDRSILHDGSGPEPGIKDDDGRWDVRPHARRLVRVTDPVLVAWASLIDESGTPPRRARALRPINTASQRVLAKLATAPRLGNVDWTPGWHEKADRDRGYFKAEARVPAAWNNVILQGPHFTVATPFAKQPRPTFRNKDDLETWGLEQLPERAIPRTSYQPAKPMDSYLAGYSRWDGEPTNGFFRLAWRRMADSSTERTLHAALIPPGAAHIHGVLSSRMDPVDLAVAASLWASLPADFFVKVAGFSEINRSVVTRLPHLPDDPLTPALTLRALRLNCLTADYEPLWQEVYDAHGDTWAEDSWTFAPPNDPAIWAPAPLNAVSRDWTMATPLRRDWERRQALVEIDAIVAVMLGITADELCAIYRTQFGVLRKYERRDRYDRHGRKVDLDVLRAYQRWDDSGRAGRPPALGRFELPFRAMDREADMTRAHDAFARVAQNPAEAR
ncbi:MAG: DNA methyltransferase [Kineosporiaceae bacterium]